MSPISIVGMPVWTPWGDCDRWPAWVVADLGGPDGEAVAILKLAWGPAVIRSEWEWSPRY